MRCDSISLPLFHTRTFAVSLSQFQCRSVRARFRAVEVRRVALAAGVEEGLGIPNHPQKRPQGHMVQQLTVSTLKRS